MTFTFRPAARTNAKPLIGLYAMSGAGKTYSALLLARGFVGPNGTIGMIETESGRGEAYADPTEYPEIGGYQVLSLHDDFSPTTYGQAITAAENAKLDALIIDSASAEWSGVNGVLGMAAANQADGKKGPIVWQQPKMTHKREFMLRFMQTPIPLVILCMRAKYPMREVQGRSGRKEWVRSEHLVPDQADDILFEMFVHGWIGQDHAFNLTKCTAKALEPVFQSGQPISAETGRQLAAWAGGESVEQTVGKTVEAPASSAADQAFALASVAAGQGTDALNAWWNSAEGKRRRDSIRSRMDELRTIAQAVDAESVPDEDPFAGAAAPAESASEPEMPLDTPEQQSGAPDALQGGGVVEITEYLDSAITPEALDVRVRSRKVETLMDQLNEADRLNVNQYIKERRGELAG